MIDTNSARIRAIEQLQKLRDAYAKKGDHFRSQAADDAITLALSPNRKQSPYLSHECFRDAKKLLVRRRKRESSLSLDSELPSTSHESLIIDASSNRPDHLSIAHDLQSHLEGLASKVNFRAMQILQDMINEEPVAATSKALGCSERLVKKVRAEIRKQAVKFK